MSCHSALGNDTSGAAFSVIQRDDQVPGAVVAEIVMTFFLVLTVCMSAVNRQSRTPLAPFCIGLTVTASMLGGYVCHYPLFKSTMPPNKSNGQNGNASQRRINVPQNLSWTPIPGLQTCCVAFLPCLSGGVSGGCLNPALAFGSAVVDNHWSYHWVYWAGPLAAAVLVGLVVR